MLLVFAVLVRVCVLQGYYSLPLERQSPQCSSYFDFQEKFLEKNIRMEITMDTLKNKVETELSTCQRDIKTFQTELKDMLARINTEMKASEASITEIKENAEKSFSEMMSDFKAAKSTLTEHVNTMSLKYTTLEAGSEGRITKMQEKVDQTISELKDLVVKKDVVFQVKGVSPQPTANDIIKFLNVVTNTDNVYDTNTGYFTAPVNGTYWFAAQLCTHTNYRLSPSIYIGGSLINRVSLFDKDWGDCSTVNAVGVLQRGDNVTVKAGPALTPGAVWDSIVYNQNTFMGALMN